MLRSRFFWKLYAGYSALILLSAVVVGGLITQQIEQDTLAEVKKSLETRAVLLRDLSSPYLLANTSDEAFQHRLRALSKEIDTRLTVIQAEGVVIADSDEDPAGMDNHTERPEILAARSYGLGTVTRYSYTLGMRMMYLALPVRSQDQFIGYVRTAVALSTIDRRLDDLRGAIVLGAGISAMIALLLGLILTHHFARPLATMTTVAESMSRGDYDQRLLVVRKDEIGELSHALNRMAESCRERTDTIIADRNKLSVILSGMAEGVIAVSHDERVVHLNDTAGKLFGISPQESVDKPIWQITRIREVCEILSQTLREDVDIQKNLQIAAQSRDQFIKVSASPLHDSQGDMVGAVAVLHDVSELNRLESIRREFVANASHELKTPITAIRGLVETLIDDESLAPPTRERFLGKIKDQSIRLSSIVTDLLTLSRLESPDREHEGEPFDLCEVILTTVKTFMLISEERGITLESQVPDAPIEMMGDEESLCQVVSNLLDNALKYTPEGGRVWVRLERQDNESVIEVQDTGIGIEPQDQERIFERFYRVDKARSRELGGTGLGLCIVKHIVIAHGGRVAVSSVPGTGSTFRVMLPFSSVSS